MNGTLTLTDALYDLVVQLYNITLLLSKLAILAGYSYVSMGI